MKDILGDEEISHPLNENLLREAEEIKGERRTYRERVERLEETRSQVSDSVYKRVRSDYLSKLGKTTERLVTLKRDLEAEEKKLVEKKNLVEVNIRLHRERIEESSLRQTLGEFTAEHHRDLVAREEKEIARLDAALRNLADGLERHRGIFEGEDLSPPERPAPPPPSREASPPPPPSAPAEREVSPPPIAKGREARKEPPPFSSLVNTPATENTAKIRADVRGTDQTDVENLKAASKATPVSSKRVSEILVMDNGKIIQNIPLDRTIVIGRSPSNDIVLKEPKVSRRHAEIQSVGGRYIILDLESSNGTYVAGKKVTERVLQPNDEITIGNTKMLFKE